MLAGGLFLLSSPGPQTPFWVVAVGLAVAGFGTGTFISPNTSALLGAAPPHRQGIASGVQAAGRNVGMVLGIGLAGAIFTTHLAQGTAQSLYQGIDMGFSGCRHRGGSRDHRIGRQGKINIFTPGQLNIKAFLRVFWRMTGKH